MQQKLATIVAKHNGQFNKNEYFNKRSVITFSCEKKHQWSVQAQSVFNGSWCKECFILFKAGKHLVLRNGLQQAQKIADDRNGLCLSEKYVNSYTPLLWRCSNGHQWSAIISDVKKGTWCPHCSVGVRERLCRFYFESFLRLWIVSVDFSSLSCL
jgi:hypothetical protein